MVFVGNIYFVLDRHVIIINTLDQKVTYYKLFCAYNLSFCILHFLTFFLNYKNLDTDFFFTNKSVFIY